MRPARRKKLREKSKRRKIVEDPPWDPPTLSINPKVGAAKVGPISAAKIQSFSHCGEKIFCKIQI